MAGIILEMKNITKTFPGVKALENVNLKVREGEIHSICGENGAGKSTLMKVLSGVYPHGTYEGDILFQGKKCEFKDIKQSEDLGIVIIHQELALIPYLSIAENIYLGNERANRGIVNWKETFCRYTGTALEGGTERKSKHAGIQHRGRQAATGRNCESALQKGAAAYSG